MLRRRFLTSFLALVGLAAGKRTTPRADFAPFFIAEIRDRGGKTRAVDPLPPIMARWAVERDDFGFQIRLFDVQFDVVDAFMTRILGEPQIAVPKNLEGNPQRMYDTKVSGMHLQLTGKKDEISIVAIGGKKRKG